MKRFLTDIRGNASLMAAFLMVILFVIAVVGYTGAMLYSTFQTAQTEMDRAATVSVDVNLANSNVRDLVLNIPAESVLQQIQDNLELADYVKSDAGDWVRMEDGKSLYHLKDVQMRVTGQVLSITATLAIPLPWAVGSLRSVELPLHTESHVLYLN